VLLKQKAASYNAAYHGCHDIKHCQRQYKFEESLEGRLCFASFIHLLLKDASSVFFAPFTHPQSFARIPIHEKEVLENKSALSSL